MRYLFTGLGFLFTGLGGIGVILPDWLINTEMYKKHLADFAERREMPLRTKVILLVFSSAMILLAIYFSPSVYMQGFLGLLIAFKYYYFIFKVKTVNGR